jgi:rRNA-processing protein FCF1
VVVGRRIGRGPHRLQVNSCEETLLHVIIDTSIYRKDPKRDKVGFRALGRLCKGQKVKLYVPEVVKREFVSQQKTAIEEHIQTILNAAKSVSRRSKESKLMEFALKTMALADTIAPRVESKTRLEFKGWIEQCGAEVLAIRPKHGNRVIDDYFGGNPPFTSPKHRDDIPDSFIFQNIVDVASDQEIVNVIVNDGALFKSLGTIKNVKAFKELDEFINTEECQEALEELTGEIVTHNIERAKQIIPKKAEDLNRMIDVDLVNVLAYQTVRDSQIPEDNQEATITMVGAAEDVEFDFDGIEYYGGSEIGIPFRATTECLLNYAINQSDYYTMNEGESAKVSISELNDHYFDAEQDFPIRVKGKLSVEIKVEQLENPEVSDDDLETAIVEGEHKVEVEKVWVAGGDSDD